MAAQTYYSPFIPAFSSSGAPVPGAKLYFYYTGTTVLAPIFSESSLNDPLPNPVVADLAGRFPDIYLDSLVVYRVKQTDQKDVTLGSDIDPYIPGQSLKGEAGEDATLPQRYDGIGVSNQTRIPATGKMTDNDGAEFDTNLNSISLFLNGSLIHGSEFTYNEAGKFITLLNGTKLDAGTEITVVGVFYHGGTSSGGLSGGTSDGVPLHSYPGTTPSEDPSRCDHSNVQLKNALLDITNPVSKNFGKWVDIYPLMGAGEVHANEVNGAINPTTGLPVPAKFLARKGDTLLDCWSQNGEVPKTFPADPIFNVDKLPGNLLSGSRIRLLPGARVRRPDRDAVNQSSRPLILCCDPNPTPETTVDGTDTQQDVYLGIEIICVGDSGFIGENHRFGYVDHVNHISLNGASDFYIDTKHYGCMSDAVYLGAGNRGGNVYNRLNQRGRVRVWADGLDKNNRNALSIVSGNHIDFFVYAKNFSKPGGAAPADGFNINSGVGAPGPVDIEPNVSFTTNPRVHDITGTCICENSGGGGIAILLGANDPVPHPVRGFRLTCHATNVDHGAFVTFGASNQKIGYDAILTGSATDCYRPFEINSGQGFTLRDFLANGSIASAYIGYINQRPSDFNLENVDMIDCGKNDTAAIQVRGWDTGYVKGLTFKGTAPYALHLLNGLKIEGLSIEAPRVFGHTFGFYNDPSDGGAIIDFGSIKETNPFATRTASNYNWAPAGSQVSVVPNNGTYRNNQIVYGSDWLEPGSPFCWRAFKTNTSGSPFFVVHELMGGAEPDPTVSNLPTFTLTNMRLNNNGRFTATAASAKAVSGSYTIFDMRMRGLYSGTGSAYFGVAKTSTVTGPQDFWAAWWLGNDAGPDVPRRATPIYNGNAFSNNTVPVNHETVFRVRGDFNDPFSQIVWEYSLDKGTTWFSMNLTGVNAGSELRYPAIMFGSASETGQLLKVL